MIAEFRFIKLPMRTEMTKVTEIIEVTVMILTSEKWLFKAVMILNLTNTALAAATV